MKFTTIQIFKKKKVLQAFKKITKEEFKQHSEL